MTVQTKYGTAGISNDGYYKIYSKKEGNHMKLLHRLIFEDFYQTKLPSDWIIHHEDENKTNNEIWNLIPMTRQEHVKFHNKGKTVSETTRVKMSNSRKGKKMSEETKQKLREINLGKTLSEETKAKISKNNGKHMLGKHHPLESRKKMGKAKTQTGIFSVSKANNNSCNKGFIWRYIYYHNGKQKTLNSINPQKLKEKVLAKGLDWIVLDEEKAKECGLL